MRNVHDGAVKGVDIYTFTKVETLACSREFSAISSCSLSLSLALCVDSGRSTSSIL